MGQKILVVEDNELNLKLFCDLLRAHGYEAEPVRDGREALDRARAFAPDLVVMDIQMPHISGLELIEQMKADAELRRVPIMAVTAYAAKGDEERIRDAGAEGYVSKPISVLRFVEAVQALLDAAAAKKDAHGAETAYGQGKKSESLDLPDVEETSEGEEARRELTMKAPLVPIDWPSIYFTKGVRQPLPKRMAQCTPDMKQAVADASKALEAEGGKLFLSDMFRSHDMQAEAHNDFVTHKKKAFSPPPGGSLHEAGRAFDLDLDAIHVPLKRFWELAAGAGLVPIIDNPISGVSESWHFECRGSHQRVYDYYKAGKGTNFDSPYKAMAASAICSVGIKVDKFGANQDAAYIQSGLIRLGAEIGSIDGAIGTNTKKALTALGIPQESTAAMVAGVDAALKAKFPGEF